MEGFQNAFGPEAVDVHLQSSKIRVISREEVEGRWQQMARVEVVLAPCCRVFKSIMEPAANHW